MRGKSGWWISEAHIALLLARVFDQRGNSEKSLAAPGRALRIGGAIGMIDSFVDEGQSMRELLERSRPRRSNGI
jgi:LuxR family maltose regulon positive regulatory protein